MILVLSRERACRVFSVAVDSSFLLRSSHGRLRQAGKEGKRRRRGFATHEGLQISAGTCSGRSLALVLLGESVRHVLKKPAIFVLKTSRNYRSEFSTKSYVFTVQP